jgi:hypothetical protein
MRYSEISEFNQTLTNIWIEGGFNEAYSYGQEWSDVPFTSIKKVGIETCDTFTKGRNRIEKVGTKVTTVPIHTMPIFFQNALGGKDLVCEWDVYIRPLPENATWLDIFRNLDQLVGDSGDTHHRFPEELRVVGETLFVSLGS